MNEPRVEIRLDADRRAFRPGERLAGEYRVADLGPGDVEAVELSVVWYTEGKGDEDLAVHFFQRLAQEDGAYFDLRRPARFATDLPRSPLSYEGAIVSIRWCVRVRVFPSHGKEIFAECPFQLGEVPPAARAAEEPVEPPAEKPAPRQHAARR